MRRIRLQRTLLLALVAIATLTPTLVSQDTHAQFQTGPTLFSGQATALQGKVLGIAINPVGTGPIAAEGGTLETHLLCYPAGPNCVVSLPDFTNGAVQAEVLNATVVAQGNHSRAQTSVADVSINVLEQNKISATFIEARAVAQCNAGQASVSAASELATLTINGQTIVATGEVNQTVELPAGVVIKINEQFGSVNGGTGTLTVRALHITIPGPVPGTDTDIIIAEAHADIMCGQRFCPVDRDFVTGGGWVEDPTRKNFAVAGGFKNGAFWGHLMFIDHATRRRVKGTGVTGYGPVLGGPATARQIQGTFREEGQSNDGKYDVVVNDRGEPGREDSFVLSLNGIVAAQGFLKGGNIQLHTCK